MNSQNIHIGTRSGKGERTAEYIKAILKDCRGESIENPAGF